MWNMKAKVTPTITGQACLKIIQKIPKQRTWKARHQGTTENSHTGHCTYTSESTDISAQKV
jgi:hypothetical protein